MTKFVPDIEKKEVVATSPSNVEKIDDVEETRLKENVPTKLETAQEEAARRSIEANVELAKTEEVAVDESVSDKLAETITELDVEQDSAGVKLVVTRDNQTSLVISIGLPTEAINSVVNAMFLVKKILHASRGEINGAYAGIVRR